MVLNPNLLDYKIMTFLDIPKKEDTQSSFIEMPSAWGPYGAKGFSETAMVAIAPANVLIHSPQFAVAAASEAGISGFLDAAKALAMTVVDLLADPEILAEVKEEFRRKSK